MSEGERAQLERLILVQKEKVNAAKFAAQNASRVFSSTKRNLNHAKEVLALMEGDLKAMDEEGGFW